MTLGNILSNAQISALKSVATAKTDAEKYTSYISEKAWEMIYDMATKLGQKLSPKFWQMLDMNIQANSEVMVCMKGKKEVSVMPVIREVRWARHLGAILKSGYSIVWVGEGATIVSWNNWESVYRALTKSVDSNGYDAEMSYAEYCSIKIARQKEREFYDLARPIRNKKLGRRRITFEEARAMTARTERFIFECRVEARARKMLEAL